MNTIHNNIYPVLTTFNLPIHQPNDFTSFALPLCTIQDSREPSIFSSNVPFLCIIEDIRFPNELNLQIMKPFICTKINFEDDPEPLPYNVGYAWSYLDDTDWVDNAFQSIHGDDYTDTKVIGFIKL